MSCAERVSTPARGAIDRSILRYIGWRLVQLAIVLVGVSVVVFFTMHVLPGDVAMLLLGDRGTAEQLAKLRLQLGLDQPVVVQYLRFVAAAAHGDFGTSLTSNRAAFTDVSTAFPVTLQLTLAALEPRDASSACPSASSPRSGPAAHSITWR